jgi:hypothetical protein
MEVSDQLHVPSALSPRKDHLVLIGYEAGWAPEMFWFSFLDMSFYSKVLTK